MLIWICVSQWGRPCRGAGVEVGAGVCEWWRGWRRLWVAANVCRSVRLWTPTLFCLIMSVWLVMKFDYASKGGGGWDILISSKIMHETAVCNFPLLLVHLQIVSSSSLAWNFCISIRLFCASCDVINAGLDSLVYHQCGFNWSLQIHHALHRALQCRLTLSMLRKAIYWSVLVSSHRGRGHITHNAISPSPPHSKSCYCMSKNMQLLKCRHIYLLKNK